MQGFSLGEIIERIPNLSKGTLNYWLKDIELTKQQKKRLLEKSRIAGEKGRLIGAFANHTKRIERTRYIVKKAKVEANARINDPFFVSGVMLYWAEGEKSTSMERVGFANSDPLMIQYMMKWFREYGKVPESKFRISLQIMALHDLGESEKFWSGVAKIPLTQFFKTIIKPTPLKRNPSYMGTCSIVICSKDLFRKIMGWKFGLLEYYNIR